MEVETGLLRVHLVGVGGAGMSAIAHLLVESGTPVSGSDIRHSPIAELTSAGVRAVVGHRTENLDLLDGGPTEVVVSTAIRSDNPEVAEAHRRGIPVIRRAEALAALMGGNRGVCVAGSAGKTTTSAMLAAALRHAGLDPSYVIGGEVTGSGSGGHLGSGDIFVAEADESDGSFLAFAPTGAVITNMEPDHLDHYCTAQSYIAAFDAFAARIRTGGFLAACIDDPDVAALVDRLPSLTMGGPKVLGYGRSSAADVRLGPTVRDGRRSRVEVTLPDGGSQSLSVSMPGDHMLLNAVAALTAGMLLGVAPQVLAEGITSFGGVRRRFEYKGTAAGVHVYDDYAHNPAKVRAQLTAARAVVPDGGRLVVLFQPHLYSRTATFATEFAEALSLADQVVVLDVYGSREDPQPGISGALIADQVTAPVIFEPRLASAPLLVAALARFGDVLLTMGAGDVTRLGPQILALLDKR